MNFRRKKGKKPPRGFQNGNGNPQGIPRLQLESGDPRVKNGSGGIPYAETEPPKGMMPSGIYLVCTFGKWIREGEYDPEPRDVTIFKAEDALTAMQQVYMAKVKEAKEANKLSEMERADARMVVFDFYTGDRTEASVEGEWKAHIQVAQDAKASA